MHWRSDDSGAHNFSVLHNVDRRSKRAVIELALAAVDCFWEEKSVTYIMDNISFISQLILLDSAHLCEGHPYLKLRQQCAQLSMNVKSSPSATQVQHKCSADIFVQNVAISFPFRVGQDKQTSMNDGMFVIKFGTLMLRSGDFLENFLQSFYPHDLTEKRNTIDAFENQLADIETKSMWPSVDKILFYKLNKSRNSSLNHLMFSAMGIELSLLDTSGCNSRNLTSYPWNIKGSMCFSHVMSHVVYPMAQCEIYASPLDIVLSSQVFVCRVMLSWLLSVVGSDKHI